ncbi:hypothetical protein [Blautia sp. OF09-25XD]|uniref:hypothetical protein n=1 Tax=Blautia sp. OF09-25XD TaxID=2292981 RepID=UPI000E5C5F67|nr:hypothetical protein [Blautia sp. OF09-25XD]RHV96825.1 hypothetical protein DXA93_03205 [Blautia sp. OF09-25XD]
MKLENYFRRSVFGTDLVRKVASVLSICIIAGLLIVYVPNIIAGAGKIGDTVNAMKTADLPFGKACTPHSSTEPSSLPMSQSSSSMPNPSKNRRMPERAWQSVPY